MSEVPRLKSFKKDFRKIYTFLEESLASRGINECEIDWITTNKDGSFRTFTIKVKGLMYFMSVTFGKKDMYLDFDDCAETFLYGGSLFNRCYEAEDIWEELSGKGVNAPREPETVYYGCLKGYGFQPAKKVAFYFENMEAALRDTLKEYGEDGEYVVKSMLSHDWDRISGLGVILDGKIYSVNKTTVDYVKTMHPELKII